MNVTLKKSSIIEYYCSKFIEDERKNERPERQQADGTLQPQSKDEIVSNVSVKEFSQNLFNKYDKEVDSSLRKQGSNMKAIVEKTINFKNKIFNCLEKNEKTFSYTKKITENSSLYDIDFSEFYKIVDECDFPNLQLGVSDILKDPKVIIIGIIIIFLLYLFFKKIF